MFQIRMTGALGGSKRFKLLQVFNSIITSAAQFFQQASTASTLETILLAKAYCEHNCLIR